MQNPQTPSPESDRKMIDSQMMRMSFRRLVKDGGLKAQIRDVGLLRSKLEHAFRHEVYAKFFGIRPLYLTAIVEITLLLVCTISKNLVLFYFFGPALLTLLFIGGVVVDPTLGVSANREGIVVIRLFGLIRRVIPYESIERFEIVNMRNDDGLYFKLFDPNGRRLLTLTMNPAYNTLLAALLYASDPQTYMHEL